MLRLGLGLALSAWAASACAADKPVYAPPAAWVLPAPQPAASSVTGSGAVRVLLTDQQVHLRPDGIDRYGETVLQIQSSQGLQALGNVALDWSPDIQTLVVHKLQIIRAGQTIDLLAGGNTMTILRRETNLEQAMLDGRLTAAIQPPGLQIGDILDVAITYEESDPLLQGHAQSILSVARDAPVDHMRLRVLWPKGRPVHWRETEALPAARLLHTAEGEELLAEGSDLPPLDAPKAAPTRFAHISELEVTDFADWAEAGSLMGPLYTKAATLAADSPLKAEAAKIRASSADPKVRAAAALHLVQDKVRYLYLGMNLGGYLPADADLTWTRRFGDCKGKTALLLALLRELGIQAEPAFVNSRDGDTLSERLPSVGPFDHVIVRAVIAGKVYWLDGTRVGDRGLDDVKTPPFKWALPLQAADAKLEKLVIPALDKPDEETSIRLDASAGPNAPAPAHVEFIARGDTALTIKLSLAAQDPEQRDRFLREYWKRRFDFIDMKQTSAVFNEGTGEEWLTADGVANMTWKGQQNGGRFYQVNEVAVGWRGDFDRLPGPNADAPFALGYPLFNQTTEAIILPRSGAGFTFGGEDVDKALVGFEFKRHSKIEGGAFISQASTRSLTPELAASDARAGQAELRRLAGVVVYVQEPVGGGGGGAPTAVATPANAAVDAMVNEGYSLHMRGQLDAALAELNHAAELAPDSVAVLVNRGEVLLDMGELDAAQENYDKAFRLNPNAPPVLVGRGRVYYAQKNMPDALESYDRSLKLAPDDVAGLVDRGLVYAATGRTDDALADYNHALQVDPYSVAALADRAGVYLARGQRDAALADADKAISLDPNAPAIAFRVRALALAAQHKFKEALAAADRAVVLQPREAITFTVRAEIYGSLGRYAEARKDIDRALQLDPQLPAALAIRKLLAGARKAPAR